MAKVGKLFVDFEARTATFEERTKRARRSLGLFGKAAEGSNRSLGRISPRLALLSARFLGFAAVAALASESIKGIRIKEQLEAQLKVATGSAENATIAFSDLERVARKMPNSLQEVTREFIRLKNLGLDASEESLLSYGNTAAAMGKSLNQMIEAVADATVGEFERLKEFGIKSSSEGDRVTFTFRGVSTTVRKSADEIEAYLRRLGEVEFAGSMAAQMETIDGKISNLTDAWFNFSTAIGEKVGLGSGAKWGLDTLAQGLNDVAVNIRTAFMSIDDVTLKEMALLQAQIERAERGGSISIGFNLEKARAKLAELQAEKELKEAIEARAQTEQRAADGTAKLAQWEAEIRHRQRGVLRTYAADHKALMNQIHALQVKIREGAAGNVDGAMKELEALYKQQEALTDAYQKAKAAQDDANRSLTRYESEWVSMRRSMKLAFAEGIAGGQKLGEVLEDVARIWARSAIFNLLLGKLDTATGLRSGGVLDGIFGGLFKVLSGRATGGAVAAGQLYRVNEGAGQMEYFRPSVGGQVLPLGGAAAAGGGVTINMNVDARGADSGVADRLLVQLPQLIRSHALSAFREEQRRRGL